MQRNLNMSVIHGRHLLKSRTDTIVFFNDFIEGVRYACG